MAPLCDRMGQSSWKKTNKISNKTILGAEFMLEREINVHDGCPNRNHCRKDESKCCYLVKGDCIIGEKE
jgi:hypothetical protein